MDKATQSLHKISLVATSSGVCETAITQFTNSIHKTLNVKQSEMQLVKVARLPTKHLEITTRKTPCGNGTKSWDRFEMHIHKRTCTVMCSTEVIGKALSAVSAAEGLTVKVTSVEK